MIRKFYIIAGEISGDIHGAALVVSLRKFFPEAVFKGFGGNEMSKVGVEISVGLDKLSIMGFVEVIKHLGTIRQNFKIAKEEIVQFNPDAVIFIDFPGFNLRMARWAKKRDFKVFYYIAPMVWAWGKGRISGIKKYIDKFFVILPFEEKFFTSHNVNALYIGHPLKSKIAKFEPDPDFYLKYKIRENTNFIAVFPGSRPSEIEKHKGVIISTIKSNPNMLFVISIKSELENNYFNDFRNLDNAILIADDNYNVLAYAYAGIIKSGTSSLEAALFSLPHVVIYKTSLISYLIIKNIVKIKFASLVNLILNKESVHELLQYNLTDKNLSNELMNLLNSEVRKEILKDFEKLKSLLTVDNSPTEMAGKSIYDDLTKL